MFLSLGTFSLATLATAACTAGVGDDGGTQEQQCDESGTAVKEESPIEGDDGGMKEG